MMGAALASKDGRLQAKSVAVYGSPSCIRPVLTAIGLVCEDSHTVDEDLTILSDSMSSTPGGSMRRLWAWRLHSQKPFS